MANAETAAAEETAPTKVSRKLILFGALGLVVLIATGVAGAWALGMFGAGDDPSAASAEHADGATGDAAHANAATHGADNAAETTPIFVDLPQMLVNLVSERGGSRFLKLALAVEVDDEATAERIRRLAPRIVDSFQLYLRTLTPEELRGPGSMFRLKEDLHVRIHQAIAPAEVRDVLFKEMLVQ